MVLEPLFHTILVPPPAVIRHGVHVAEYFFQRLQEPLALNDIERIHDPLSNGVTAPAVLFRTIGI